MAACIAAILDACGAAGFSPDFVVEAHDYATAVAFVATGLGVTMVPRLALDAIPAADVAVRPVARPTPVRAIHVLVDETTEDRPALSAFLGLLRDAAASHAS